MAITIIGINSFFIRIIFYNGSKVTKFKVTIFSFCNHFFCKIAVQNNLILNLENYMIPCFNKQLFGIDCLGCGTQRAIVLILKGDFIAAFYQFPAIYTTLLFFGFVGLHFFDKNRNYHLPMTGLAIINAIIMIVSYIYKMTHL